MSKLSKTIRAKKKAFAQGGEAKGVNPESAAKAGISQAGFQARIGRQDLAKKHAKKHLEELRSMPNPKLQGLAKGGEVPEHDDYIKKILKKYKGC